MKRWAWITVGLYMAMLAALAWPVCWLAFGWGTHHLSDATDVYGGVGWPLVWIWAGLMAVGQVLLLLVPVGTAERRPKARRKLWIPIVVTTVLLSILACIVFATLVLITWGESGPAPGRPFEGDFGSYSFFVCAGFLIAVSWVFWGALFNYYRKTTDPDALTSRLMRWLFVGSVLELLVAVPSHIIVRERGDCCAPIGTFLGMVTGVSVMLMAFGPGVFFLFARRIDRLRRKKKLCLVCGYDIRASAARCPECGTTFDAAEKSGVRV